MSEQKKESKYAKKRRSGKMMYGPTPTTPKYPEFRSGSKKCLCDHEDHQEKGWTYAKCEFMKANGAKFNAERLFNERDLWLVA